MTNGLDLTVNALLKMQEFESRTGLPAVASLEELELSGGRHLTSTLKASDGNPFVDYVILDFTGKGRELIIYKKIEMDEKYKVHFETNVVLRY